MSIVPIISTEDDTLLSLCVVTIQEFEQLMSHNNHSVLKFYDKDSVRFMSNNPQHGGKKCINCNKRTKCKCKFKLIINEDIYTDEDIDSMSVRDGILSTDIDINMVDIIKCVHYMIQKLTLVDSNNDYNFITIIGAFVDSMEEFTNTKTILKPSDNISKMLRGTRLMMHLNPRASFFNVINDIRLKRSNNDVVNFIKGYSASDSKQNKTKNALKLIPKYRLYFNSLTDYDDIEEDEPH